MKRLVIENKERLWEDMNLAPLEKPDGLSVELDQGVLYVLNTHFRHVYHSLVLDNAGMTFGRDHR